MFCSSLDLSELAKQAKTKLQAVSFTIIFVDTKEIIFIIIPISFEEKWKKTGCGCM